MTWRHSPVPALLFCRTDRAEANPAPLIRAVRKGFVLGNHSHSHRPAGALSFKEWKDDFEQAEAILTDIYARAGVQRPGLYYRFPYIDRGDGDRIERRFPALIRAVRNGQTPDMPQTGKIQAIQDYLADKGFHQPFQNITHPLYQIRDIAQAADCLFTYSTCDWMLTPRHLQKDWPHKSIDDLKTAIDTDPYLSQKAPQDTNRHIILLHDQDGLLNTAQALIGHMLDQGFDFIGF